MYVVPSNSILNAEIYRVIVLEGPEKISQHIKEGANVDTQALVTYTLVVKIITLV